MASYPRQIPAGGEGTISIRVNTSGYGGKTLNKHIDVYTSDPTLNKATLTITGEVLNFVQVNPTYARLVGPVGSTLKKEITITREKAYPFRIVNVKARSGKDIAVDIKELKGDAGDGYILTIENTKTAAGRYADTVVLTTDSKIKPTLTVPVYGQITAAAPQVPQPKTETSGG